jgi:signal transduction histidine kinase
LSSQAFAGALWASLGAAAVSFGTIIFAYQLVYVYYVLTPEGTAEHSVAAGLARGWFTEIFFGLGTFGAAFLARFRASKGGSFALGPAVGVLATAGYQGIIALGYPPIVGPEALAYLAVGLASGSLGGTLGAYESRRRASGERALSKAMETIAEATEPNSVARALSTVFSEDGVVGVGVWRNAPMPWVSCVKPDGEWSRELGSSFSAARLIWDEVLSEDQVARTVSRRDVPRRMLQEWDRQGIGTALVVPLLSVGGSSRGMMLVGFDSWRRLTAHTKRLVNAAAAGAWIALEKRESDRRTGVMEERERFSREIHDSLIQYLGSIAGELDAAEMATEAGAESMAPVHIGRAREAARLATGEARRLMRALRPEVLDGSSLPEALSTLARRVFAASGVETTLEVAGQVRPLAPDTEHDLARIAQEALTNARKHSHASRVSVSLSFVADQVKLVVADDGGGLHRSETNRALASNDANDAVGGFGFRSMRERTERINGRMRVESSEGIGTKIIVETPT